MAGELDEILSYTEQQHGVYTEIISIMEELYTPLFTMVRPLRDRLRLQDETP